MPLLDETQLREPAPTYRPVAMWFLNGDLDEAEVVRQVHAMGEGGVGGIQIAARTGLNVPYLSERWFHLVARVLEEAAPYGMEVWLADEYPYPSGVTGGEVILRHPEYRAMTMRAKHVRVAPGEAIHEVAPGTVLLRACAVPHVDGSARWDLALPLEGHTGIIQHEQVFFQPTTTYNTTRRYMVNGPRPTLHWEAPAAGTPTGGAHPDRWEVWLIAAQDVERYKFFGGYVDLCNPDAVRFFIQTTYDRYLQRLGPERFAKLTGFFVDESHPQNWSWHLPDFFKQRCGYDLYEVLPALWTDVGERTARIRYDYMQSLTDLFVESFHKPLAAWCTDHGVQLSLEVGSTRNVVQRYAHVAGIDPGHNKVGVPLDEILDRELGFFRNNLTFPASLAAQMGRNRVLDEVFHSVGWSMTLQDMKSMLDHAAARGANLFAFHGFCYTIGGLKKWDAPPSEFDQNPYWPHFPSLAAYTGRLGYLLSRGTRVAPIALVDPITSLWAHGGAIREPAIGAGPDATAKRILADWTYLMRELTAAQRPHDTIDPSLLTEATIQDGALCLGDARYRVLVLPPMSNLERSAWNTLEAFAASGGTVIACGLLPYEQIEPDSDVPQRTAAAFAANPDEIRQAYEATASAGTATAGAPAAGASTAASASTAGASAAGASTASTSTGGTTASSARSVGASEVRITRRGGFALLRSSGSLKETGAATTLLTLLDDLAPADLRLIPLDGGDTRDFLLAQRRDGDEDLLFIANESPAERTCDLVLPSASGDSLAVTLLDLETGAREPSDPAVRVRFAPYGSHALSVRHGESPGASRADTQVRPYADSAPLTVGAGLRAGPEGRGASIVNLPLDGPWTCAPANENALRLDRFHFWAGPDDEAAARQALSSPNTPTVEPKPLVNQLQDLSRDGQPWPLAVSVTPSFGAPPVLRPQLPATLWYATTFTAEHVPPEAVLCLEDEALKGQWTIWVNGHTLDPRSFTARRRWDHSNRETPVGHLLQESTNEVLVRVHVTETWDGLIEPLYLLGDFGVTLNASGPSDPSGPADSSGTGGTATLTRRPETVQWNALPWTQGGGPYPYFAGTLRFTRKATLPAAPADGAPTTLRLSDPSLLFAGVVELSIDGQSLGTRPWAPFEWTVPPQVLGTEPGEREITLSLTNTLIGLLEGRRWDAATRTAVPIIPTVRHNASQERR